MPYAHGGLCPWRPMPYAQSYLIFVRKAIVNLSTHKLVGLVSSRTQSEIEKVMRQWGEKVFSQIEEVSMDMSGNYKSLVKKNCPNAEVTVDRFHVTKIVQEE